ncbi:Fusaric acid resistance protein family protein [Enhydrobacter aerosaccus]|uniref:Fusaric acid resistance protein family protein n=1 Tax=Enhydrobacter aerosaccus TaxID=225324 RepID=A0A1T4MW14_9HYPH|nr:FUSC family protein [Enhydrobacter aerosaccus]SJZ71249.1 Fusaric acid resistance protein family protein [Enhydrobacter aerosaccus]
MSLKALEVQWRWLRGHVLRRRVQIALALRVTIAAILALIAAQMADLPLPLWAVLTAVIVTQMSVGRSLKATSDYLIGTIAGAIYGGAVAILIPHQTESALLLVLVIAIAPLALIAAARQNMNVLPITAIIVLLVPTFTQASPLASAINRVLEVGLGAVVGLLVSFLVLPSSAHRQMRLAAARALDRMARALVDLVAGLGRGLSNDDLHRLQDGIGQALVGIDTVGAEAERERKARLSSQPDTGPLRRTLLRLRHDLVMVGRVAGIPLPEALKLRLGPRVALAADTAAEFLRKSGTALLAHAGPPPLEPFEEALAAYEAELAAVRREGLTRVLPGDVAERFFAVGFAFEQIHQNLIDLQRVVTEWGPETK